VTARAARSLRLLTRTVVMVLGAHSLSAQPAPLPQRALGGGWSPAAGLIGIELVQRSFTSAPRINGAVGVGLAGFGARLNFCIRQPVTERRVPYIGVGYAATPWVPAVRVSGAATVEGGMQFWPRAGHRLYVDVGAGAALLVNARSQFGPVLRLLVGGAL
jgi:hypothetical protein